MNTILTKLKDFVGLNEESEGYEYYPEEEERAEDDYSTQPHSEANFQSVRSRVSRLSPTSNSDNFPRRRHNKELDRELTNSAKAETIMNRTTKNNVIGMPGITSSTSEVVIIEPHSFEEMPQVIQTLRERRSVVLNLNSMDPEEAQRAVDFIAGGTYALDGHQERIGESIFLFAPSCVKVSTLSGIVQEVSTPPEQVSQPAPVPSRHGWGPESTRIAQ